MDYTEYTKFFIAILSIVDPLAALPVYFSMTQHMLPEQKQRLPRLLGLTIGITLLVSLFLGDIILRFFGISDGSFRIASGLLLLLTAHQMSTSSSLSSVISKSTADDSHSHAVVPLAIPLLAGPGAISTVVVYATHAEHASNYVWLSLCIVLLALVVWGFFRMTSVLVKKISPLFLAVSSKIMGLIITAVAVEFIVNGVRFFLAT